MLSVGADNPSIFRCCESLAISEVPHIHADRRRVNGVDGGDANAVYRSLLKVAHSWTCTKIDRLNERQEACTLALAAVLRVCGCIASD